jgi:AmmeMemoRadiSam system protein B
MSVAPARALVRPPIVDGIFYPGERKELGETVDRLLAASPVEPGSCLGVIAPHAAYAVAGGVIAAAFRAIQLRQARTAVLLGPVHRDAGPRPVFFLPESRFFSTPLGAVPVDEAALEALATSSPRFRRDDIPHLEEHCLEVQLPFLARLFPRITLVPVLVAGEDPEAAPLLAKSLELTFRNSWDYTVVIASANMASYLRGSDSEREYRVIARLVAAGDWRGIARAAARHEVSACGPAVIEALLVLAGDLAGGVARVEILAEGDSREADAGPRKIVRYASVGVGRSTDGGVLAH